MRLSQFWMKITCIFWVLNQKIQVIRIGFSCTIQIVNRRYKSIVCYSKECGCWKNPWILGRSQNECFDIIITDYIHTIHATPLQTFKKMVAQVNFSGYYISSTRE